MSAELRPKQWTVAATATSLTAIFGLSPQGFFSTLTVRLDSGAAGNLYWGLSNVTNVPANAGGKIKPGESVSFELNGKYLSTDSIYFVGTAADVAYFTTIA